MKINNKELLKIAQDESTSPGQLNEIWINSRSVKVRKAVASNPNANASTLKIAARLYLEEVLENPAFEMLRLFDDDSWVTKVGEIYNDPSSWAAGIGYYSNAYSNVREAMARAVLLSPKLDVYVMNTVLEYLAVSSLKRAYKFDKTRENSRRIFFETPGSLSLEATFKGFGSGLINEQELFYALGRSGICFNSCRKSTFNRTMKRLLEAYDEGVEFAGEAICAVLLVTRTTCIDWVRYSFKKKHLGLIAQTFKAVEKSSKQARAGGSSVLKTKMKYLLGIISGLLWEPLDFEQRKQSLGYFYKQVCKLGLENQEWGDSKKILGAVLLTNELCENLEKEDIRTKAFYVRSKCLGTWFHVQKSDRKFRVVEEVNDWLYSRGGVDNTLYRSIDLKKIVSLSPDVVIGF